MEPELIQDAPGGRRILKDGAAVVRPCYPSSSSVHQLLRFLEESGFRGAPRFLDTDGTSERLTYLEGESGSGGWKHSVPDEGLSRMAGLLRQYHEVVSNFEPDASLEWSSGACGRRPGQVILHGDPGPWNFVWDLDGRPRALIDWDHANPGNPLDDLAYLAAYAAPLVADDDEAKTWMQHPSPPDRPHRICLLAEGYGASADGLVDRAIRVIAKTNRTVERMAARGLEPQRTWAAETKLERLWDRHSWMVAHRHDFKVSVN